jgi:hypothetical protein
MVDTEQLAAVVEELTNSVNPGPPKWRRKSSGDDTA